ncbi:glycosyltransferase family 2 protein [Azospirillum canadense]|uniref:glycosyltransferase family 2 protein n=1 Tax=Azospirillum canadense TaxID=403962 RepID=UPI002225EAFB|nr:glycosyltransferase family 2 protein [Azospirillum canadense]MCW2240923.1 glycosyltransferase involved in cell wall biosynthesis [Azospirillum canadense]
MTDMLSVYILTLNSERRLAQVLESVQSVADEIVIVDSGSADRTHAIAHSFGARVLVRTFDNFCNQRVFAEKSCVHPWVLALDSDEVLSPALLAKIRQLKAVDFMLDGRSPDGYSIRREWFFLGKRVRTFYPVKAPDYTIKLFQRAKMGHSGSRIIHESIQCNGGTIANIHEPIFHYSCDSVEELYGKIDLYTRLAAADMAANGIRASWVKVNVYPWLLWIKWFLVNGAWRDGEVGRILSKYARDTVYLKYLKLKHDFLS